jgi:hypothetical protein
MGGFWHPPLYVTEYNVTGGLGLFYAPYIGLGYLVWLLFALRSLALWRVCAIAPCFGSGWRACLLSLSVKL